MVQVNAACVAVIRDPDGDWIMLKLAKSVEIPKGAFTRGRKYALTFTEIDADQEPFANGRKKQK